MARDQREDGVRDGFLGRLPDFLFSLRWRFSLVLSLVILLSTAVCILTAVKFLQQTLTDRAAADLQGTMAGTSAYLEHERDRLLSAAELLSTEAAVKSSLQNRVNLITKLTPYYAGLNADILDVVDAHGRVVVNMEDTNVFGGAVGSMPDVRQALRGREWVGLVADSPREAGSPGVLAAVPIQGSAGIVGAVVVGRRLDSPLASELGRDLSVDVNLILGNRRTGSTETDSYGTPLIGMVEPSSLLGRIAAGHPSVDKVKDRGQTALSGLVPLRDASGRWRAAIEVVRPLDPLYGVINALSVLLLGIGIAIVIGWALLAFYLGRRLTGRLQTLETMASEVVRHAAENAPLRDRAHALPAQGRDEVASLARSFDVMITALDERMATNARLYAQARDMAAMEERARLARELHDSVTQALFSMTMHTRAAQVTLEREGPEARERLGQTLGELGDLTRGALAEMRALIFELRPNALAEEGLSAALEKHGAAVSAREGLPVEVHLPDSRIQLDPTSEEHLYRLAQEALHNAVKHARATRVEVHLWEDGGYVLLEISDDGVGFDASSVPPGHMGLQTMSDRMAGLGGDVEILSAAGQGTTVRAAAPLRPALRRTS